MSRWGTLVVRGTAVVSVLASAVSLALTDVGQATLPVETINLAVISAGAAVMAVLLQRWTPDNNMWRVLLLIAVIGTLTVFVFSLGTANAHPSGVLVAAIRLTDVALAVPWMLFVGLFPDGHRPVPRWPMLVYAGTGILVVLSVVAWLSAPDGAPLPPPGHLPGTGIGADGTGLHGATARTASVVAGLLPLIAALCLALRYRRSGPVVRQQIRVGVAGMATSVVLEVFVLGILPGGAHPGSVHFAVVIVAVGTGAFGVAAGLLRWRLWLVDQALPRAVVLGACSAAFTAAIVLTAVVATGGVHRAQVQGAAVAALVVTVFVQGYSRRLEPWVRQTVYGRRPGGYAVLVGLADGLAGVDDETAAHRIADAACRGLAVPWAALWVPTARAGIFRLAARSGDVELAEVIAVGEDELRDARPARLLPAQSERAPVTPRAALPDDSAALTVLSAEHDTWGLLAVGQRRGEPLTTGDLELLTVITHEAELAHANRQLIGEVAASLDELRERARQLQDSRQRLVAAQDEERRRIERDLHDGAQHELITLAGKLRQMARAQHVPAGAFEDLADQAEQAVFSLQDLARGIYPSVLTDHGVAAAIRSYVGQLPLDVVLETAPEVARRRWPAELEVALYFVAVEAVGNSRKHARATTTTVTLAERGPDVVLEIHDNGVGFDPGRVNGRSGLQHMSDRMAALGGSLLVDSRVGAGTWVTAAVPCPATVGRPDAEVSVRSLIPEGRAAPPVLDG
jgi:signal transduction histidine kinase